MGCLRTGSVWTPFHHTFKYSETNAYLKSNTSCCRFVHQRVARGKDMGWVHDFQHCNELQPLCLCMYNYVWIMLLNCVGTSHRGILCCQSLCFHIWQELWSGRWAIYMLHTYTHCHHHSGKMRGRGAFVGNYKEHTYCRFGVQGQILIRHNQIHTS